jgi:hypothetical protein
MIGLSMSGLVTVLPLAAAGPNLGLFEAASDVGLTPRAGANIWGAQGAFDFVRKRVSRDFVPAAHRKAASMIRQSLEPDAPYAEQRLPARWGIAAEPENPL